MTKYYGRLGFAETSETRPGIWEESIVDRNYYGDILRNGRRLQTANNVNDNISISISISVLLDPYAERNFHSLKYAEYMGKLWKIDSVDVEYPRLILSLGGLYHQ